MDDKNPTQPLKPLEEGQSDAAKFPKDGILGIEVPEAKMPLTFRPKPGEAVTLGRKSMSVGSLDLDLSPYGAYGLGVSRNHAEVRRSITGDAIELRDLGSSNGTYFNDQKLSPHGKQRLSHGDEFRIGEMRIRVLFLRGDIPLNKPQAAQVPDASAATLDLQNEIAKIKNLPPAPRRNTSMLDASKLPGTSAPEPAKAPENATLEVEIPKVEMPKSEAQIKAQETVAQPPQAEIPVAGTPKVEAPKAEASASDAKPEEFRIRQIPKPADQDDKG